MSRTEFTEVTEETTTQPSPFVAMAGTGITRISRMGNFTGRTQRRGREATHRRSPRANDIRSPLLRRGIIHHERTQRTQRAQREERYGWDLYRNQTSLRLSYVGQEVGKVGKGRGPSTGSGSALRFERRRIVLRPGRKTSGRRCDGREDVGKVMERLSQRAQRQGIVTTDYTDSTDGEGRSFGQN